MMELVVEGTRTRKTAKLSWLERTNEDFKEVSAPAKVTQDRVKWKNKTRVVDLKIM